MNAWMSVVGIEHDELDSTLLLIRCGSCTHTLEWSDIHSSDLRYCLIDSCICLVLILIFFGFHALIPAFWSLFLHLSIHSSWWYLLNLDTNLNPNWTQLYWISFLDKLFPVGTNFGPLLSNFENWGLYLLQTAHTLLARTRTHAAGLVQVQSRRAAKCSFCPFAAQRRGLFFRGEAPRSPFYSEEWMAITRKLWRQAHPTFLTSWAQELSNAPTTVQRLKHFLWKTSSALNHSKIWIQLYTIFI